MYPLLRSIYYFNRKIKTIDSIWTPIQSEMRVWPGDIDIFLELNNGRYLTLMDFGRFDYFRRLNWPKTPAGVKWGGAVAGVSIRYRKRMTLFKKFDLHTRLVALDDRWWYFCQTIEVGDTIYASALIRFAVLEGRRSAPVERVETALNTTFERKMPDWVKSWDESDSMRPWVSMRDYE